MLTDWVPLIPMHTRMLRVLEAQRTKDPYASIGWAALREDYDRVPLDVAVEPLKARRMIEDCANYRPAGHLFARATTFGLNCLVLGLMPARPVEHASQVEALLQIAQGEQVRRLNAGKGQQ